ncbi:MAG: SUMF1/EgtB/PvdO family nonheme iron enzyme [Myxococcales bacterium]|nr:SUMF1/EgtB/PvdO family nonheme iron enzyme [Myxococcales bacterium]
MRPTTLLCASLGLAACTRGPEPVPAATAAPTTPAPAPAPAPAPEPAPVAAAPAPAPAPEPAPPPGPELPVAPDGTRAVACLDPPPAGVACIPGGPFIRGSDTGPKHSRPQATVWLQTFYMDLQEVTYSEYKACEKDGKCGKAGPLYNDFNRPRQPISGISWYNAVEFCKAQGKHLPTEAQWEKAARGPDGKTHPWGDEPATCERAVIKDKTGRSCGTPKKGSQADKGRTYEIGSRPPYQYGLHDMSGNSWEWVADWMSDSYEACGKDCEGVDPLGPCAGAEPCKGHSEKIVRGGSWYWDAKHATALYRRPHFPKNQPFHHFGFRCAASVAEAEQLLKTPALYAPPPNPSVAPPAKTP